MFDDVFGMVEKYTDTFRSSVRDSFGASIITDVLDPIRDQIVLVRSVSEEFQRESLAIRQALHEASSMTLGEGIH